jgi:hypothetical protein
VVDVVKLVIPTNVRDLLLLLGGAELQPCDGKLLKRAAFAAEVRGKV